MKNDKNRQNTYLLGAAAAALTSDATRQFGPEFGRERPLHLPVCGISCDKERCGLLGSVAPIHVEGELLAVLDAEVASQALQFSPVIVSGRAVTFLKVRMSGTKGTMPYESK